MSRPQGVNKGVKTGSAGNTIDATICVHAGTTIERRYTAAEMQRLREAGRRVLLHDPRRALGADHAPVDRVLRVAIDVPHLPVTKMNADATAACAHVAGGRLDLRVIV